MIRVRIRKGVKPETLLGLGYAEIEAPQGTYYSKTIGTLEIQAKLSYPMNLRIQNWSDPRVPWILFKFLLALEEGTDVGGKIKVHDLGKWKILDVQDTLNVITDLSKYTDIAKRLGRWYSEYIEGNLKL